DHGTALDRAGSGKVSYSSLVEAIELAHFMRQSEK
ncbi:MAG: 4-hydroxythreonine-4-phosphate dehydrogenase PdxA, partial [Mariprofundaceae bacterium]|nr:4-hydroxythreonine-4-phosphate dehydrogenase PdxA [Mariprofundaceae bacterium]